MRLRNRPATGKTPCPVPLGRNFPFLRRKQETTPVLPDAWGRYDDFMGSKKENVDIFLYNRNFFIMSTRFVS
jgi:hypothetical protein